MGVPGMPERFVSVLLSARRSTADPDVLVVRLAKGWWLGPGQGAARREILELRLCAASGQSEDEAIAAVLETTAAALRGPARAEGSGQG